MSRVLTWIERHHTTNNMAVRNLEKIGGSRTDFWQRVIFKIEYQVVDIPVESSTVSCIERNFRESFETQICKIYFIFRMLREMYCILDMKSLV